MANGTITSGGTAQALFAAYTARQGWFVQNVSTSDLWVSDAGTAVINTNGVKIPANSLYETPPGYRGGGAVTIIGATTGQTFVAREW
jgi:hypothetical protein